MRLLPLLALFCIATPSPARYFCGWCPDARVEECIEVKISVTRELCYVPSSPAPVIDGGWLVMESHFPPNGSWNAFLNSGDSLSDNFPTIRGCTDTQAANFNAHSNFDDGSCLYGPLQCGGHSTVTFDGYTYPLVGIGTQCWFKENLRSDNYRNGDAIPGNLSGARWGSTKAGAQAVYGEDSSLVLGGSLDEVTNLAIHGRLYNWYATQDSRGLCPTGFHVPSDEDWMTLEMSLGMTEAQASEKGYRGTDQGTQMKSSSADTRIWDGSNVSGFSGLPSGFRGSIGGFSSMGRYVCMWSSSPSEVSAINRCLKSGYSNIGRDYSNPQDGFSIRCVRDAEIRMSFDSDAKRISGKLVVRGCMDTKASNFNPAAIEDDGSCLYGPLQCGGHSTVTFDGYTYPLVGIGTQCWFKENLRSDNYRNGDAIPRKLRRFRWNGTTVGAQIVYGEGSSLVLNGSRDEEANLFTYGRLYNWYAIKDSRGLCPSGFHVPNELDWKRLEMALGMTLAEANASDWHGTNQGSQMKSSYTESPPWNGSNTSGFSGVPGGHRTFNGFFVDEGICGYWWNSDSMGGSRTLCWRSDVGRIHFPLYGFSVRCVRD
jgi:uncharacterized protein (TIGR02145 family)